MKHLLLIIVMLVTGVNGFSQTYRALSGKIEAENYDAISGVGTEATEDAGGGLDVGWMNDSSYVDYHVNTSSAGFYTFKVRIANGFSDNASLQIKGANGTVLGQRILPRTGGMQGWTTVNMFALLPAGDQTIRFYAERGVFALNWFEATPSAISLPGKVESENFELASNVRNESAQGASGGANVTDIDDNDWLDYNVNVTVAGTYSFFFRVANAWGDGLIEVKDGSGPSLGQVSIPRTGGWQNYITVSTTATLTAGSNIIRLQATRGAFNFDWFEVAGTVPLLTHNIPGKIQAEEFHNIYNVQTENSNDSDGTMNVSGIDNGDWMDYHVNVPAAGPYAFNLRVASAQGNGLFEIKNESGNVLGAVNIPWTGGWQSYATFSDTLNLPAGHQVLRLYANRGGFNFNWFDVQTVNVQKPAGVISFEALPAKSVTSGPFTLTATSTNTEVPITFSSSNTAVITVSNAGSNWQASVVGEGSALITASQTESTSFSAASPVSRTQEVHPDSPSTPSNKITIDGKRWYQLTNAASSLEPLFDGNTQVSVNTGWGKVVNDYEAYYPLLEGEQMSLQSIKFFDHEGSAAQAPMTLSVITSNWERIEIASFKGYEYNSWVGPYPDAQLSDEEKFKLNAVVGNIKYLVLRIQGVMPTEIEFYGTYTPPTQGASPVPHKSVRLGDTFGVNGYEWNFEVGNNPQVINEPLMNAAKSFSGFRHYMDWEKLESQEGVYSYNPTISGGWNYDAIYERCKAENIEVLACLKTLPGWMLDSYPAGERDNENTPVRFGMDFAAPASYIEQAKMGFQYAARYGSNTAVDPALLSTHSTPRWYNDVPNSVKIGLNLVKYIECDNERDKWWKGRKAYQTAREYAANLSAFYDGHKNTMGAGVGVKNADPNMKVVIAGLVTGSDYIKGMVDWCREFRGYKSDGSVNLCWDIVNFHLYIDNSTMTQSGTSTRGTAPENINAKKIIDDYVKTAHEFSQDMPVWITETGYDINQGSPLKAIAIGSKSELVTQADWILRTSLVSARSGIEKVFYYQMYDDNNGSGMFGTSGLLNSDQTRRPAADYLFQVNKQFGNYRYKETLNADPIVDRYELDGKSMYVLTVPDEIGRTAEYTLNLNEAGVAKVFTPQVGSNNMSSQQLPIVDGQVTVTAGETPIFVIADNSNARVAATEIAAPVLEEVLHAEVTIFPNPTTDFISIDLANEKNTQVEIKIFEAATGRLHHTSKVNKPGNKFSHRIDIAHFPASMYIVEVSQEQEHAFRKVAKLN
ncbi:carbohydrate-binding protein [Dyadobacter sp. CY343]|uniref:carbohydrate-binding protein n=1 Tax=Dyadobacter sp. CY343 TaxID=2907299 RepID=UPI001F3E587C|nr:carbohydrate-binding protein [Dyadobacter sp. CY343]MCE7058535.1 carbohydrate-binding protein [Dyadobacter sp. CY343]